MENLTWQRCRETQVGFDYRFYLKTQKIYGLVTAKEKNITVIKENNTNIISQFANKVANKISLQANLLLNKEKASVLTGILIGNKDGIDEETQENFRNSNLTHMLAVSGSHVSYILLGICFIISKMKLHKRFSKLVIILILFFFMLITGSTPSVMRACIMAIYLLIGNFFYKKVSVLASLSFSILVSLIINPYCIFDIGLQLSYGGTIGIVYLYPKIKKWLFSKKTLRKIKSREEISLKYKVIMNIENMFLVTVSANLAIFPIMIFHFNTLSLMFWLSNLLAGPIMGIIVIVGFLTIFLSIISFPIATIFSKVLSIFLHLFSEIARICANLPFSKILIPTPSLFFIFTYYFILSFILIRKKLNLKIFSKNNKIKVVVILMIIIICTQVNNISSFNNLKIFFIDVGQGDSMLIVTPKQKTILVDGGGNRDKESFDVGKQVLLPYLLDRGITKIDYCLISHFDSDHVGGLFAVLENLKVKNVIISKQGENSENYKQLKDIVNSRKIKVIVVKKGDSIQIEDNIKLDVLWPKEKLINENVLNNNSIVAKFSFSNFSMLLTGDIEKIAEEEILKEYITSNIMQSTILKVAHHRIQNI